MKIMLYNLILIFATTLLTSNTILSQSAIFQIENQHFQTKRYSKYVLDASAGAKGKVQIWENLEGKNDFVPGGKNQYWKLTKVGEHYKIENLHYAGLVLDASAGTKGKVQLWKDLNGGNDYVSGGKNQLWHLVKDGSSYKIENAHYKGMVLDASAGTKGKVQLWEDMNGKSKYTPAGSNQKWYMKLISEPDSKLTYISPQGKSNDCVSITHSHGKYGIHNSGTLRINPTITEGADIVTKPEFQFHITKTNNGSLIITNKSNGKVLGIKNGKVNLYQKSSEIEYLWQYSLYSYNNFLGENWLSYAIHIGQKFLNNMNGSLNLIAEPIGNSYNSWNISQGCRINTLL